MNELDRLPTLTMRDSLTGLPGMNDLRMRLAEWIAAGNESGERPRIHALLIGLMRFDAVNLAYGTRAGDRILVEAALRISRFAANEIDGPWLVARIGGGNFLLIANEACSRERWQLIGEQVADAIGCPIVVSDSVLHLSPRVALLRGLSGESGNSMFDRLGQALSRAARQQGRRISWADGEATPANHSAAQLEADLLGAIDRDEIEVFFQPQFSLPDDSLTGAEALARWNHSKLGRIGAGALFALAERVDHVAPLSRHIAAKALDIAWRWPGHLRLSLNIMPADLSIASYARQLAQIVRESGFGPDRLTLEVTEHTLLHDVELAAQTVTELTGQGIRTALDDFGAGFCNFRYLKLLPLHYLKLDRSMVQGITVDQRDLTVLRAIVAMATALDLKVIAEGIENEAQRDLVAKEGCASYQGFVRAGPMDAAAFAELAGRI